MIQHKPETTAGWRRKFEDLIPLSGGRKLVTLRDAADYITSLPKKESDLPEWQTAIAVLMLVSQGGPTMMARIGVMKALNRDVEHAFNPERKDTHWGSESSSGTNDLPLSPAPAIRPASTATTNHNQKPAHYLE